MMPKFSIPATEEELAIWRRIGVERPPTQDELPYTDEMPVDNERQGLQMDLLFEPLRLYWADRSDVYVGRNQFVHFSLQHVRSEDYLGPDIFVVVDVAKRERLSWVVWEEGKAPDVVIEILSDSTRQRDKGEKKQIYQDKVRATEYFWYDPWTGEVAGFALHEGLYEPIQPDNRGRLSSVPTSLLLTVWQGTYRDVTAPWLRWATSEGVMLPTGAEQADTERRRAEAEAQRAEAEAQRADEQRRRAEAEAQRAEQAEAMLRRYRERYGDLPQ